MELYGTHGTTASRAASILSSKSFTRPGPWAPRGGRAGPGYYFWASSSPKCEGLASWLAESWWSDAATRGQYQGEAEPQLAILKVTLRPQDNEYCDATQIWFKEALFEQAARRGCANPDDVYQLYGWVLDELEDEVKQKYAVVEADVACPQSRLAKLRKLPVVLKVGRCYVVRHQRDDIIEIAPIN
ncbi:hypothetical protein D3C87_1323340 [compost metagenome]